MTSALAALFLLFLVGLLYFGLQLWAAVQGGADILAPLVSTAVCLFGAWWLATLDRILED